MSELLQFEIEARDGTARAARVRLPRGEIETPVFMPVGTQGTVKGLTSEELEQLEAQVVLANAYHLALRPGSPLVAKLGGLHAFMGWRRLILTDSGGFQLFSLRSRTRVTDEGVLFRSHLDGSEHFISPRRAMEIQAELGADIAMALDQCPPSDAPREALEEAMARTTLWARECVSQPRPSHQARFGIVQGGVDLGLRRRHLDEIAALPFDGYALGGLSVGETPAQMHEVLSATVDEMPANRPRYLMGVGRPEDLVLAIGAGVDMFDCVMPTRNARNGNLFTSAGRVVISNARHREADLPIDEECGCSVCQRYSRAYLRHLYSCREILYSRLATYHNLHFVLDLVRRARRAIQAGQYSSFAASVLRHPDAVG